jgi:hypothetical protein
MDSHGLLNVTGGRVRKEQLTALDWRIVASSPQLLDLVLIVVIIILLGRIG